MSKAKKPKANKRHCNSVCPSIDISSLVHHTKKVNPLRNVSKLLPKHPVAIFADWDDTMYNNLLVCYYTIDNLLQNPKFLGCVKKSVLLHNQRASLLQNAYTIFKDSVGTPLADALQLVFDHDKKAVEVAFKDIYSQVKKERGINTLMLPGARKTIREIRSYGLPLAAVSNKNGDLIRSELAATGVLKFYTDVVGEGDTKKPKPDKEPMERTLALLAKKGKKINPKQCWYIGDSPVDVKFAVNTGCHPVIIGNMDRLVGEGMKLFKAGKLTHVDNHEELQAVLKFAMSGKAPKREEATKKIATKKANVQTAKTKAKKVAKKSSVKTAARMSNPLAAKAMGAKVVMQPKGSQISRLMSTTSSKSFTDALNTLSKTSKLVSKPFTKSIAVKASAFKGKKKTA